MSKLYGWTWEPIRQRAVKTPLGDPTKMLWTVYNSEPRDVYAVPDPGAWPGGTLDDIHVGTFNTPELADEAASAHSERLLNKAHRGSGGS